MLLGARIRIPEYLPNRQSRIQLTIKDYTYTWPDTCNGNPEPVDLLKLVNGKFYDNNNDLLQTRKPRVPWSLRSEHHATHSHEYILYTHTQAIIYTIL